MGSGALQVAAGRGPCLLGQVAVIETVMPPVETLLNGAAPVPAGRVALHFLCDGRIEAPGTSRIRTASGDLLVTPARQSWRMSADRAAPCIALVAPLRLAASLAAISAGMLVPRSPALDAARLYLLGLLDDPPTAAAAVPAGRAALEFASAALTAYDGPALLPSRREAGLLDRVLALVEADPARPWDAAALGGALGCSRSTLYRAAAPAGGVAELVVQHRLAIAHRLLADPAERRPLAAIADRCGFGSAALFGRRFRRLFGISPGEYRRDTRAG